METIFTLASIGALAFLGKIGLIAYEALQMDFNFDKPWPEDLSQSGQEVTLEQPPVPSKLLTRKAWMNRLVPSARLQKA